MSFLPRYFIGILKILILTIVGGLLKIRMHDIYAYYIFFDKQKKENSKFLPNGF